MVKILTIDCDEVLCNTAKYMLEYTNFFHNNLSYENITLKELSAMYSYIHNNLGSIIEKDASIIKHMQPIIGSQEAVHILKQQGYSLYVVTGRTENMQNFTCEWLNTYFPSCIEDTIFCNHYAEKKILKSDFCREIGSSAMIDDDPRFVHDMEDIPVFLMERPWNSDNSPAHVQCVKTWEEIITSLSY